MAGEVDAAFYFARDARHHLDRETFCFTYGDGVSDVNISEAVAHEYAAAVLDLPHSSGPGPGSGCCAAPVHGELPVAISLTGNPGAASKLPLRSKIGNPADPRRRPVMTAVTTLTLRWDRDAGEASMILLWRDPAQVASGGGLYQVAPAGMFQPSHNAPVGRAEFSFGYIAVHQSVPTATLYGRQI